MSDPGVVERVVLVFAAVAVGGCASRAGPPGEPIDLVWESPPTSQPGPAGRQSRQHGSNKQRSSARPVATVNGQPIDRGQFVQWLIEAHGLSLLQQMMALELVKQAAAEQGITVGRQEVEAEYRRCLSRLYPVDPASPVELSRQQQERALELVLRREGVSRQELMLKVQRDAYVRKLAERELKVDEQDLRREYRLLYGPKVQIRLILCSTLRQAERIRERLEAGEDFAELARRFSLDPYTAAGGGLTRPFALSDPSVPAIIRAAAERLRPGQVSQTLRSGDDYLIIKLEKTFPASNVAFEDVRQRVRRAYRQRVLPELMQSITGRLIRRARVAIFEPVLRRQYRQRWLENPEQAPPLVND